MSDSKISIPVSNILGSAAAGIVARCTTHPLDTVKSRLQADTNKSYYKGGPIDAIRRTLSSEGISGLYRGFGTVIIGGTPGTIVYLCSYDYCKAKLSNIVNYYDTQQQQQQQQGNESFLIHFVSGVTAEAVACLIYVPVDVIKERLQVQRRQVGGGGGSTTSFHYNGGWDALKTISQTEGLRGIYRGYGATLASFGPFSALYFVFYEKLKLYSRKYLERGDNDGLPLQMTIFSSATAGALASWLTSPLDMAKLRLQVQRGRESSPSAAAKPSTIKYRGMADCLKHAYGQGGIKGLFRGAGARVLHFVPATTVTMSSYETFRSFFQDALNE